MTNLNNRISKLEQQTGTTRYIIARPDWHDDTLIHILENGQPEDSACIFTEAEYQQWVQAQPDNVTVIRLVYQDVLG